MIDINYVIAYDVESHPRHFPFFPIVVFCLMLVGEESMTPQGLCYA